MADEIRIDGLPELLRAMQALPRELVSKNGGPVRAALFQSAKLIRDEARSLAPEKTGLLKKEIRVVRDRNPAAVGTSERYTIGVRKGKRLRYANTKENRRKRRVGKQYEQEGRAFYWRFLEFGTSREAARPFLRPAFDARRREAAQVFADNLRKGVQRVVTKLAKSTRK